MKTNSIYTSYKDNNDLLLSKVCQLYFEDNFKIADITYGKGVFWKKIDLSKYKFYPSDLITCKDTPYDFKNLPYNDNYFDVVVFDPPYCHNPGNMIINANYKNKETTKGFYHKDIINLYEKGMIESNRILKKLGLLFVKCKDEIESSKQKMSHIEIYNIATEKIDLDVKDLFILTQKVDPVIQFKKQQHARKNHSYLWVFKKKK